MLNRPKRRIFCISKGKECETVQECAVREYGEVEWVNEKSSYNGKRTIIDMEGLKSPPNECREVIQSQADDLTKAACGGRS